MAPFHAVRVCKVISGSLKVVESSTAMALGSEYDSQIIKLLALRPMSATALGKQLKVDDGALTVHLINVLLKDGLIRVVDATGSNPVWDLTEKGQERREQLGYP